MKLRLGPIPTAETVKITISISVVLRDQIERYMELHRAVHSQSAPSQSLDIGPFIAHIVATFIARDRAFLKALRDRPSKPA